MTDKYTEEVTTINTHVDAMKHELSDLKREIKSARLTMQRESEFSAKHRAASAVKSTESWSEFFWRKSVDVFRYIIPRGSSSGNQTVEGWTAIKISWKHAEGNESKLYREKIFVMLFY